LSTSADYSTSKSPAKIKKRVSTKDSIFLARKLGYCESTTTPLLDTAGYDSDSSAALNTASMVKKREKEKKNSLGVLFWRGCAPLPVAPKLGQSLTYGAVHLDPTNFVQTPN